MGPYVFEELEYQIDGLGHDPFDLGSPWGISSERHICEKRLGMW